MIKGRESFETRELIKPPYSAISRETTAASAMGRLFSNQSSIDVTSPNHAYILWNDANGHMKRAALAKEIPARFQKQIIDSGGVKTRYGVVEDARFKNIPRVAYRSSMGRYKMVGLLNAGRGTGSELADANRKAKAIATASSDSDIKPFVAPQPK